MKFLMILTVGFCLLFAAVPVVAQSAADEAAIREASKQAAATVNKGDLEAHADVYADPFDTIQGSQNRATHIKNHKDGIERSKGTPTQRSMLDEIGLVFLTPDVAIHKYRQQLTGGVDDDGKALPQRKNVIARVYIKQDGKWLTRAIFITPIEE